MKIAVVTVHDSANFGSFLQAYALNEVLKSMGHKVYFLQTRDKNYVRKLYYDFTIDREAVLHPFRFLKRNWFGIKKYRLFLKEQQCFLEAEEYEALNPDMVILGSDEIWNIKTPVFTNSIFYGAGMQNVIAYAVSVGLAEEEDFAHNSFLSNAIKKIPVIFARDDKTARCVAKITGELPDVVCDPTFLLDIEQYSRPYHNQYLQEHEYLLVYTYAPDQKTQKILREFAKKYRLKLVSVCFYYDWCDYNIICSPLEFCQIIKGARYVITTTFHGTIFSILNQKRFVSVPLSQKTIDVIWRVGLENKIIQFDDLNLQILEEKLFRNDYRYHEVNKKIEQMRSHSFNLLKKNIEVYRNDNM